MRLPAAAVVVTLALAGCGSGSEAERVENMMRDANSGAMAAAYGADLDTLKCTPAGDDGFTCRADRAADAEGQAPVVWRSVKRDGDRVYATDPEFAVR